MLNYSYDSTSSSHESSEGKMASEFLADIEGKLEKLTEPHHVSKLSRYDSYILELTQYIVTLND